MSSQTPSTKIFVIGMPGAGKTTLGKTLSDLFDVPFFDLDDEIVSLSNSSIPDIFQYEGEVGFRKYEHQALKTLCEKDKSAVIATGGGTPCFHSNLEIMKRNGITVFINTPRAQLVERLSKRSGRPLLDDVEDAEAKISQLWGVRKEFYNQADIIVSELSGVEIKKRIEEFIQSA